MPDTNPQTELVCSFLKPWETDFTETDGSRTYAVHAHVQELIASDLNRDDIYRASTVAANIVRNLFSITTT